MYEGNFTSWEDVQREFRTDEKEPEEVIKADYSTGNYEGSATVVYRNGDQYFEVHGSHCSCYGLEGQWNPKEIPAEIFHVYLERLENGKAIN